MAHDVFISHASKDKPFADQVVTRLEAAGLSCWVAPRDIQPGASWAGSIVEAIEGARVMVVVFSQHANQSHHVGREVERAIANNVIVVPLRIEDVTPDAELEYFLSSAHWLDAIAPPIERHLDALAEQIGRIVGKPAEEKQSPGEEGSSRESTSDLAVQDERRSIAASRRIHRGVWLILAVVLLCVIGGGVGWFALHGRESVASDFADYLKLHPKPAAKDWVIARAPSRYPAWRAAAERGDPKAQYFVGLCFEIGVVVPKNLTEGFGWLQKAADAGQVQAMAMLGTCLASGQGVAMDQGAAMFWYRKAAAQGDSMAQLGIGVLYARGMGVPKDATEAVRWIRQSAEQGNEDAMVALGQAYAAGRGVAEDQAQAFGWYQKAADRGNKIAIKWVAACYQEGEGVAKDQARAIELFKQAATGPDADPEAMLALGVSYRQGLGTKKDPAEAMRWLLQAANAGNTAAMYQLASMYNDGEGTPRDKVQAMRWIGKAADGGYADALVTLGRWYATGNGVAKDESIAVSFYRRAGDLGNARGMYWLGVAYGDGAGVPQSYSDAAKCFASAAQLGDGPSMTALGVMARDGKGYPVDPDIAHQWFVKGTEVGDIGAMICLGSDFARGYGKQPVNLREARRWLDQAGRKAVATGEYNLLYSAAITHYETFNEPEVVRSWIDLAASNGVDGARQWQRRHPAGQPSTAPGRKPNNYG